MCGGTKHPIDRELRGWPQACIELSLKLLNLWTSASLPKHWKINCGRLLAKGPCSV